MWGLGDRKMALSMLLGHLHTCLILQGADKKTDPEFFKLWPRQSHKLTYIFYYFLGGGGLAPPSQNVVTLSRTPWQSDPEGYMDSVFY